MNWSSGLHTNNGNKKFKGIRRRKWGKWVSEIRVPGSQERLWLGTYATAEAAAVAHDVAVYCLRRPSTAEKLNFPEALSSYCAHQRDDMSPRSVQRVASDFAMDVDARKVAAGETESHVSSENRARDGGHVRSSSGAHDAGQVASADVDVLWWEGLGGDDGGAAWQGLMSRDYGEGEALSISIEDYL
ncbi:ethylene-responsive transcription factor ERF019-like [Lotus japonicus]|uniref:ethylene-responsive transcription factor ERF019-like n=1 Tax=Lotus japonicus TaxID=34305 RepID=UPI00258F82CA|nr:ethylene-responsive transcription factor ERF019-like [Lotus japonicus]